MRSSLVFASFPLAFLAVTAPGGAQGRVFVVDHASRPGTDFTTINAAMSAAAEGDVVLVRTGEYVFVDRPSAHLVTEAGARVRVIQGWQYQQNASSSRLVQAIRFGGLDLDDCAGPLWFERSQFGLQDAGLALEASNCDAVVLSRCIARSRNSVEYRTAELASSRVHVHESEFVAEANPTGFGSGPAVRVLAESFVELFGTSVLGADGVDGTSSSCRGGDGFDALHVLDASKLVTLGANLVGGAGGQPFGVCEPGADGEPLVLEVGSTATALAGGTRSLEIDSPVREGQSFGATFRGEPGDQVWLRYASAPGLGLALTGLDGEFLLSPSSFGSFVGTIPASGEIVQTVGGLAMPAGWESTIFWCQAVMRDAETQRFVVSSPSALVLLDETL